MKLRTQTWLLAALLLLCSGAVWAQPGPCDPAAEPGDFGSCQAPNIDFPNGGPGCYICQAGTIGGPPNTCVPSDAFCQGISGGEESNDCRIGVCIDISAGGITGPNPSGCDYDLNPDADENCVLCNSPDPVPFDHCGNGICEPVEGEDCSTCSVDCRLPGFDGSPDNPGVCPLPPGDSVYFAACEFGLVFDGPPYNTPGFGGCEDGDICTDDVCAGNGVGPDLCISTPKECQPDADFCCAAGCTPPADGASCREVTGAPIPGCDPDCYVPQQCAPTPSPTPTATPIPPRATLLEGSGIGCSLSAFAGSSSALSWLAGMGLLAGFGLSKRRR